MSSKPKVTLIHAVTNFNTLSDGDVVARALAIIKGMTGNLAFLTPPVDLTALTTSVTTYSAAIATALDGGKNAKTLRDKQRIIVIKDLRLLAVYVENNCNDDPSIFSSSGFVAATTVRAAAGPAAVPVIRELDFGSISGQFLVYVGAADGARSYNLRYAAMATGVPGTWTVVPFANVKKPVTVSNLTPGTTYSFQVQALGSEGLSDWSDSTTSMCI